jgi:hypothetical protein
MLPSVPAETQMFQVTTLTACKVFCDIIPSVLGEGETFVTMREDTEKEVQKTSCDDV